MKIGTKCTICGDRVGDAEVTRCDTCGRGVHERCREYETSFECPRCGDEVWIDAVEF